VVSDLGDPRMPFKRLSGSTFGEENVNVGLLKKLIES